SPLPDEAHPAPYTLSLHDALPIYPQAELGGLHDHLRGVLPRLRLEPDALERLAGDPAHAAVDVAVVGAVDAVQDPGRDRGAEVEIGKSTRLNSSHVSISYAVFCLK